MKNILPAICLSLAFPACHSAQKLPAKQEFVTANSVRPHPEQVAPEPVRLSVSFISRGAGTDGHAKEAFYAYLAQYSKTHNQVLTMDTVRWGREGEVDFCFLLNDMAEKEQQTFVTGVRQTLAASDLVQIQERQPCRMRRRRP